MVEDWLPTRAIMTTDMPDLEEINKIFGAYLPGKLKKCTSYDIVQ